MTQVNLLPPEVHTRQRARRWTAAAVGSVAAACVLVGMVYVLQTMRLAKVDEQVAAQEAVNAGYQAQIADLQKFADLKQHVSDRQRLVDEVLQRQVLWSGVLRNVSSALPGGLWLTSLTGNVNPPEATAPGSTNIGTLQMSGTSFEHTTVGAWLNRLEQVPGWVNAWVSQSTKQDGQDAGRKVVVFTNTVDLTEEATVDGRKR